MLEVDLPTVFVDLITEGPRATCVRSDNMLGSYAVVRHLLELGHRRFALFTGHLPGCLVPNGCSVHGKR